MVRKTLFCVIALVVLCQGVVFGQDDPFIALRGAKICLDPGISVHKKKSVANVETEANLRIGYFLQGMLEEAGARVSVTDIEEREFKSGKIDRYLLLLRALKIAGENKSDIVISIHHGYSPKARKNYVSAQYEPKASEALELLSREIAQSLSASLKMPNLSDVKSASLAEFSKTKIPIIYINSGLVSDKSERKKLKAVDYSRKKAVAIFKGIASGYAKIKDENLSLKILRPVAKYRKPSLPAAALAPPPAPAPPPPAAPVEEKKVAATGPEPFEKPIQAPPPVTIVSEKLKTTPVKVQQELPPTGPLSDNLPPSVSTSMVDGNYYPFDPLFPSPVDAIVDNSWLYGERISPTAYKRGISFLASKGSQIKAVANGTVVEINKSRAISKSTPYKKCIVIKHNESFRNKTVYSVYGRVNRMKVKKGAKVKVGTTLGFTGESFKGKGTPRWNEFEFEIRLGKNSPKHRQNPELFIRHFGGEGLGVVVGKIVSPKGKKEPSVNINGIKKPAAFSFYGYSKSYTGTAPGSLIYDENFAITDIVPGKHALKTKYQTRQIEIKPNQVLYIDLKGE